MSTHVWQRIDRSGLDTCRLYRHPQGWSLQGTAVFVEAGRACSFFYAVLADEHWVTRSATVEGHLGSRDTQLRVRRSATGLWRVGNETLPSLSNCLDIDLGFTPATNLLAIRRLALRVGQTAESPAAWLSSPSMRLKELPQTYARIARDLYSYEAPTVGYKGKLTVARNGTVITPGLFESPIARFAR